MIRASAAGGSITWNGGSEIEVDIQAAEGEESQLARVTMLAYTGAAMRPGGWKRAEPVIVDVDGMAMPKSGRLPLHRDHDQSKVIGHSNKITANNGRVTIDGIVSATNAHAAEVVGSSKNGFPWQASIGAAVTAEPEYVAAGQRRRVNGQIVEGPVYIARHSRLREVSFVSLGADDNTSAVAAAAHKDRKMNPELKVWLEAKGFDTETLSDESVKFLTAQWKSETEDETETVNASAGTTATATATKTINATGTSVGHAACHPAPNGQDDMVEAMAAAYDRQAAYVEAFPNNPEIIARAIREQWDDTMVATQKELTDLRASYSTGPAIHRGPSGAEMTQAVVECAMHRAHDQYGTVERHHNEQTLDTVDKLQASGRLPYMPSLKFLAFETLRAHGQHVHAGSELSDTLYASAASASSRFGNIQASSGFSTISLPNVLSALMHKRLLDSYRAVNSVFRQFCRISSVSDFKTHNKMRILGLGDLEKLGATGEIKHTDLDEDAYTISVDTRARMISLTRKMRKNDDLNALLQIPTFFGDSGARTLEKSVFEVLLSNTGTFFNSAATVAANGHRPNALAAGAAGALQTSSIATAKSLFLKQQDKLGRPIMVEPSMILAPAELDDTLETLLQRETILVEAGNIATNDQMRIGNKYRGRFAPVTTPWLDVAAGLTNGSDTGWYMLARPTAGAIIDVAFLDGRQTPFIESDDTDFNTLGTQWRAYFDWGVAYEDPRFGVFSPGA